MNVEKLTKMAGSVRTGGKGTMRRKKKAVYKTTATDDKRFQTALKKIGVNGIPGIEEINIFKDYTVLQFVNPKVQASVAANTWVVSGTPHTRELHEVLPHIFDQLGPDSLQHFKKLTAEHLAAAAAEEGNGDVPELVAGETFEAVAEEGHTHTS